MRLQVSLGSKNCILAVFVDATSLKEACFSSMTEVEVTSFSHFSLAESAHMLAGGMVSPTGRSARHVCSQGRWV